MPDKNSRKNSFPKKLSTLLRPLLEKIKSQKNQKDLSLNAIWYGIVGEKTANHTKILMIKTKTLIIVAENSSWLNELTFLKEKIRIKAKNIFFQQGIEIEDIIFKLGKVA
jgi:predicted nucleic acid-binding Zn ribbon protein